MVLRRDARDAEALGELEDRRALQHGAVLEQRDRQALGVDAGDGQQLAGLAVALDVEPARGDAVAHEEVAQVVGLLGEAVADQAHAAGFQGRAGLPGREQVLDDREQLLLGRVPGLEQVVVERDLVDRGDRGLGVGVGGQQHALGVGDDRARLHEVLGARHPRHALVGDQQRDVVPARAQLAQDLQRLSSGARAQDAEALAEATPQVARDGREDRRLVVDCKDRGGARVWAPRRGRPHHPPSGEGGMRVSPRTSGRSMASSSTKHHDQVSPGSSERMIGWPSER